MLTTKEYARCTMLRMAQSAQTNEKDTGTRIHYIPEWATLRSMRQADIVKAFPADMNVNKSTVSRWFKGSLPEKRHLEGLGEIFGIEPASLFRHPDDDWIAKFFRERTEAERDRAIEVLKAMFRNSHTGTNG